MITVMIVSLCILGLFLLLTAILSISVDFRTVIDIDRNDFVVETILFGRFRILRFQIVLVEGAFYLKTLKRPYRSIDYLISKDKEDNAQENKLTEKVNSSSSKKSKKIDIGEVYNALTHHKLRLEQMRVYINVGGDDSLATSMIWGGAETIAAIAIVLSSRIIESENVNVLVKPEFKSADFVADALVKVRLGSVLSALISIIIELRHGNKEATGIKHVHDK